MKKLCWWCCHEITANTHHLPYNYDSKRDKFYTMGQFCSWPCIKAYNIHNPSHNSYQIAGYITLMRKRMNEKITPLKAAPSRWALDVFGGNLGIEEFRKCSEDGYNVFVELPNEVHKLHHVHKPVKKLEYDIGYGDTKKDMLNAIKNASVKSETLKLKRSAPRKQSVSTLENALGLIRK